MRLNAQKRTSESESMQKSSESLKESCFRIFGVSFLRLRYTFKSYSVRLCAGTVLLFNLNLLFLESCGSRALSSSCSLFRSPYGRTYLPHLSPCGKTYLHLVASGCLNACKCVKEQILAGTFCNAFGIFVGQGGSYCKYVSVQEREGRNSS